MKTLPDQSIDLTVTDPPYLINYSSFRTKSKQIKNDDNSEWVEPFFKELSRVMKKESHLYCFCDFEMSAEFLIEIRKYWKVRNLLCIPRKMKGNGGERIFQQQFEYCIFATLGGKTKGRKFNQTQILKPSPGYLKDKRYKAKEWLYRLPDHWHWTTASAFNHDRLHPNQKNVECLKDMISLSSNEGEIVFDPFSGSGSTLVAAKELGRNYIGCELDEKYYEIATNRLKENNG
jgi:site-specific DNA-methyltransferase (adenine-specific)